MDAFKDMQKDKNEMVSDAGKASDKARKELIKKMISLCITLTVAVLAVAAFLSRAWFANNDTVTANDFRIVATEQNGFELRTEGDEIRSELEKYLQDSSAPCWLLTSESNLLNYGDQTGISPGSSGSLTFYVIPRTDGSLSINCALDIRPVMKGEPTPVTAAAAAKVLRGHLLFICKYTCGGTEQQALVDVRNGTFQIELPDNTTANQEQQITLDWFWPYTLSDANNHDTFGSEISAMTSNQAYSEYFFYNSNSSGSVNVESNFRILNHHYNEADQLIGDKVQAVVLELTADLAS